MRRPVVENLDSLLILALYSSCRGGEVFAHRRFFLIAVASRKQQQSRDFLQMSAVTNNSSLLASDFIFLPLLPQLLFLCLSQSPGGSGAAKQEKRRSCSGLWGRRTDELASDGNTSFPSLIAKHTGTLPCFL